MQFLKLLFYEEGNSYAKCLFYIRTIYPEYHFFQFFSGSIRMYIPVLIGVQNEHKSAKRTVFFLLKNVLFQGSVP